MTRDELLAIGPRQSAEQLLGNDLEPRIESALNLEWWRGYHAHADGESRKIAKLEAERADMLAALKASVELADRNLSGFDGRDEECTAIYDQCVAVIAAAEASK